jgi:hypothetical protein
MFLFLMPKGIGVLPPMLLPSLQLAQKAGDFGDNAVPDLCDRTLVERHEHSADYHNDQDDDEPTGHLIPGRICQNASGTHKCVGAQFLHVTIPPFRSNWNCRFPF